MTIDRRITALLLISTAVIVIFFCIKWFNNNFERKDIEKHTGYSSEAKRNKFLAAEYFLRELGHDVESDSNRARLLETNLRYKTILINDYGPKLSITHYKKLKTWIEDGGHLIFTVNDFQYYSNDNDQYTDHEFRHNQLLKEYGIHARYTNFSDNIPYPNESEPYEYAVNNNTSIQAYFEPDRQLIDTYGIASLALTSQYGTHLLQLNINKGKLTVLSDNMFLSNAYIGNHDHAYLLSYLNQQASSDNEKILLLFNIQTDSIFTLVWKNAKQACIAFITLLILLLWSLRNRFGPILPTINYSNRNITEHLKAIGRYSWRQDQGGNLLSDSRIACESALIKRYPILKNMSTSEKIEYIADILDIDPENIHSALYFEPTSTNEFIHSSHHLQKIWILQ